MVKPRRPSSIRWSLLRSFVTVVLLSSLTVMFSSGAPPTSLPGADWDGGTNLQNQ